LRVLSIIQARVHSERFPGKVLMKIQGKSILEHIINFLKFSKLTDLIVIATTTLPEDDQIEELSKFLGIKCFRGSTYDVLGRYYECAKIFNGDFIVRLTSDNPFVDPFVVDEAIRLCQEKKCDYVSNLIPQTFPLGYSACEVITFHSLKKLYENQIDPLSREHVTYHIRQNPTLYKIMNVCAPPNLARPNWRLTVDYEEDLELIRKIFSALYTPNSLIQYQSLVNFLDNNKELLKINKKHH